MTCETQFETIQLNLETVTMECPKCNWIFKVQKPDSEHTSYSFVKPKDVLGKIVISVQKVCRNPKCKHTFTLYWCGPEE